MQDLIEPATSLTFTQKEGEVDVTDEQGRKRVFFTDARTPQKPTGENYQEATARWDGTRLVSHGTGLHGGDISRSYDITTDGKQLEESVVLTNAHLGAVTIRYVFDIVPAPAKSSAAK